MNFAGLELTLPALVLAGAQGSLHCALMCGGINAALSGPSANADLRQRLWTLHGGRVCGYALLGGAAGGLGAALLLGARQLGWVLDLRLLAALGLVVLGLCILAGPRSVCCALSPGRAGPGRRKTFALGLAWAAVPCPTLYAAAAVAALSASPLLGALMMGAFAIGTIPALSAQAWAAQRFWPQSRISRGSLVLVCGLLTGLLALVQNPVFAAWCGYSG